MPKWGACKLIRAGKLRCPKIQRFKSQEPEEVQVILTGSRDLLLILEDLINVENVEQ